MECSDINLLLNVLNNEQRTIFREIEKTVYKVNNCTNSIDFLNYCLHQRFLNFLEIGTGCIFMKLLADHQLKMQNFIWQSYPK